MRVMLATWLAATTLVAGQGAWASMPVVASGGGAMVNGGMASSVMTVADKKPVPKKHAHKQPPHAIAGGQ